VACLDIARPYEEAAVTGEAVNASAGQTMV
jgi:hypothetical protein